MKLFRELHCPDVKVVFPDGRTTLGIDQHATDIQGLFNGTPDSRITAHPISFGSGDRTELLTRLDRLRLLLNGASRVIRGFGDLVVLVNPAFEAARWRPIHELASSFADLFVAEEPSGRIRAAARRPGGTSTAAPRNPPGGAGRKEARADRPRPEAVS